MRVYYRAGRRSGVSIGPVGMLILGPFYLLYYMGVLLVICGWAFLQVVIIAGTGIGLLGELLARDWDASRRDQWPRRTGYMLLRTLRYLAIGPFWAVGEFFKAIDRASVR
jgi:hypothetical protein